MTLILPAEVAAAMTAHALDQHPVEACGVLAGPAHHGRPTRHIPMVNTEASEDSFAFDPAEQLKVWAELDARAQDPIAYYHSHTRGRCYPSPADIAYAADPDAYYVIISTREPTQPTIRAFRIVDGCVTEIPVTAA